MVLRLEILEALGRGDLLLDHKLCEPEEPMPYKVSALLLDNSVPCAMTQYAARFEASMERLSVRGSFAMQGCRATVVLHPIEKEQPNPAITH